jgi:hypothetical protein
MGVMRLSREEARQIAVRAQLLDATRPSTLVDLVDHLTPISSRGAGSERPISRLT